MPEITGVVLAGGRSTRFGRDKLAEPYRGTPLLHHAILRLTDVCDDVVVVLPPGTGEPTFPAGVTIRVARDATEGQGPMAGLHAGLLEVRTDLALVSGGDMPDLQAPVLLEIVRVALDAPVDAVALQDGEGYRPLPCVLRAGHAAEIARSLLGSGRRRLRDLLDAMRVAVIDESTWHALDPEHRTLFDVDEPSDLSD